MNREKISKCKKDLTNILETSQLMPLFPTKESDIDFAIIFELNENYKKYIKGNNYNKLAEKCLCDFYQEGKVFKNDGIKFKLEERFYVNSMRYFISVPL